MTPRRRFLFLSALTLAPGYAKGQTLWGFLSGRDARIAQAIAAHRNALERDPDDPVLGERSSDLTVVYFQDYNCPVCRAHHGMIVEAVKESRARLVVKEAPVFGPPSMAAARFALAAHRVGLYAPAWNALSQARGIIGAESLPAYAEALGLDPVMMARIAQEPAIEAQIDRALALHRALEMPGTPGYVVGERAYNPSGRDAGFDLRAILRAKAGTRTR